MDLNLNNVAVEQVQETKLLGVTLDCNLSWSKHIDLLVQKMGRNISIVKRCSSFLTPPLTKLVLQTLALSQLDYCATVWSGTTKMNLGKLQRAQNRGARVAFGCTIRANINNNHNQLGWLKVEERLKTSLLSFVKDIFHLKIPDCLYEQLTLCDDTHSYPTRHAISGKYAIPKAKTNFRQQAVLHRAIVGWNSLPGHISKTQSKASFKKQVKQHLMTVSTRL